MTLFSKSRDYWIIVLLMIVKSQMQHYSKCFLWPKLSSQRTLGHGIMLYFQSHAIYVFCLNFLCKYRFCWQKLKTWPLFLGITGVLSVKISALSITGINMFNTTNLAAYTFPMGMQLNPIVWFYISFFDNLPEITQIVSTSLNLFFLI